MAKKGFKHIFGPVPSRRLGRSLGVDLVPFKTCSYDCIYCQLGRTTDKTLARKEYVPLGEVLEEIKASLASGSNPDYITLSGSGEPTLYSRIGELLHGIKKIAAAPTAVISNGSLLGDKRVREDLLEADLVLPSLDAGDEKLFRYVNRPLPEISFQKMIAGLIDFRKVFKNQLWLEVFLLGGVTALEAEIKKLAGLIRKIRPDRVQLNTVIRPAAENYAASVSQETMLKFAELLGPGAEVIADYRRAHESSDAVVSRQGILDTLKRRPCTVADLAAGLGLHRNEILKHLTRLIQDNRIGSAEKSGKVYYLIK